MLLEIVKEELNIDVDLKKRIEMVCKFHNVKPKFINGKVRKIKKTNLIYIEPHQIIIKSIKFLVFNNCNDIYVESLKYNISFKTFDEILKQISKV